MAANTFFGAVVRMIVLVLVLEVPIQIWANLPESERERIKNECAVESCREQARRGFRRFRIYEVIRDFKWQLHVEPTEVET